MADVRPAVPLPGPAYELRPVSPGGPTHPPVTPPEGLLDGMVYTTTLDRIAGWARKNSLWPMPFGTACCAIELMATLASRYDLSRFGSEVIRFSPRQSDVMIVSGRIAIKMMPVLLQIYEQMPEPKWVISMGACASTGGLFNTYTMIQGIDHFVPVDVYIPGCPPRPETVIDGVLMLQEKIARQRAMGLSPGVRRERDPGEPPIVPAPRPVSGAPA